MPRRELQRPIPTPILYEKPFPQYPFEPEPTPKFTREQATELDTLIPPMKVTPPPRIPAVKPTPVEEQYEPTERFVMATTTTEKSYDLFTADPKSILLIAEDQDHIVEFNRPTDDHSTKIFAKGSLAMTGKGIRQIRAKTVTSTGKLYIRVWGP